MLISILQAKLRQSCSKNVTINNQFLNKVLNKDLWASKSLFKVPLLGKRVQWHDKFPPTNLAVQRLSAKFLIKFPESLLLNYTPSPFSNTSLSPFSFVTFS